MPSSALRGGGGKLHTGPVQTWTHWQQSVLALLRTEFAELLQQIGFNDVDWAAWRHFYIEGRTPQSAIDRALERDF